MIQDLFNSPPQRRCVVVFGNVDFDGDDGLQRVGIDRGVVAQLF